MNVDLRRIESISDIRSAVRSGDVQMFMATYDIFQTIKDEVPNGVGFLAVDTSHGGDGLAVAKEIESIKDLRGKIVGAEPGFPPYLVLQYMLNKEGMSLKDVNFKDMTTTDVANAFSAGKLDAAAIYEPALSASIKARAGSKVLVSTADTVVLTENLVQDLLFSDESFAKENPDILKKIAEGYFKAVEYMNTNHDDAFEIMAKAFAVTKQDMEDFQTGISWPDKNANINYFNKDSQVNVFSTFKLVGDILRENSDTNITVDANEKLTNSIVNSFK